MVAVVLYQLQSAFVTILNHLKSVLEMKLLRVMEKAALKLVLNS